MGVCKELGEYKITQGEYAGKPVEKFYIKPPISLFNGDSHVIQFFGCDIYNFHSLIKEFGGTIDFYRSWFPTAEAAEAAAEKLLAMTVMRRLL